MQLSAYLTERGESVEQFAQRIGVHPTTIYRLLNGVNFPLAATIKRILSATGGKVTANDFFGSERRPRKDVRGRPRKEAEAAQ